MTHQDQGAQIGDRIAIFSGKEGVVAQVGIESKDVGNSLGLRKASAHPIERRPSPR